MRSEETSTIGYMTLAGVKENEGVLISRDIDGTVHEKHLTEEKWFLLQTNDNELGKQCWSFEAKDAFQIGLLVC